MAIRDNPGKNYILENSITVDGVWTPIGENGFPFTGTFDGNFHVISFGPGSAVDPIPVAEGELGAGFFGAVSAAGTVKNLTIMGLKVQVHTDNYLGYSLSAGGIAGLNEGTIINCAFEEGFIEARSNNVNPGAVKIYAGGICGINRGTISGSYVYNSSLGAENFNDAENSWSWAGGIAGLHETGGPLPAAITNCYSAPGGSFSQQGLVIQSSAASSNYSFSGGIAGMSFSAVISNCWSGGQVNAEGAEGRAGGVAGYIQGFPGMSALIQNCVALNEGVSGTHVGRIIGYMEDGGDTTLDHVYGNENTDLWGSETGGENGQTVSAAGWRNPLWWNNEAGWTVADSGDDASQRSPWVWHTNSLLPYLYWESIW